MALPKDLVDRMYADYQSGLSLTAVGRLHGRSHKTIRGLFTCRGLSIREASVKNRSSSGAFAPLKPLSAEEIDALIADAKKLTIPWVLKSEWKKWPMEKRADFIARVRAKLNSPNDRPSTPFSSDLEPFDYASPRARAIADKANAGLDSQHAVVKIDLCSQGVIWREQLWFWARRIGYVCGPWTRAGGRPVLHHVIWEDHHGRNVPPSHVVTFLDGNRNNHAPENLSLRTRDDVCRANQAGALFKKSREMTAILLKRNHQRKANPHGPDDQLSLIKQRR
ncbi:MAG: HNH endonuclease signature motif containing protein [Verrucomicrobiota bacterium]